MKNKLEEKQEWIEQLEKIRDDEKDKFSEFWRSDLDTRKGIVFDKFYRKFKEGYYPTRYLNEEYYEWLIQYPDIGDYIDDISMRIDECFQQYCMEENIDKNSPKIDKIYKKWKKSKSGEISISESKNAAKNEINDSIIEEINDLIESIKNGKIF